MQDIYVTDTGKGFPLVLVHGFLGSSEIWKLQKVFLSKYFRVITPAISGFGERSKNKSHNSIKQMAREFTNSDEDPQLLYQNIAQQGFQKNL